MQSWTVGLARQRWRAGALRRWECRGRCRVRRSGRAPPLGTRAPAAVPLRRGLRASEPCAGCHCTWPACVRLRVSDCACVRLRVSNCACVRLRVFRLCNTRAFHACLCTKTTALVLCADCRCTCPACVRLRVSNWAIPLVLPGRFTRACAPRTQHWCHARVADARTCCPTRVGIWEVLRWGGGTSRVPVHPVIPYH